MQSNSIDNENAKEIELKKKEEMLNLMKQELERKAEEISSLM